MIGARVAAIVRNSAMSTLPWTRTNQSAGVVGWAVIVLPSAPELSVTAPSGSIVASASVPPVGCSCEVGPWLTIRKSWPDE